MNPDSLVERSTPPPLTLSRLARPILNLACPALPRIVRGLDGAAAPGHVVVAFRDLRLLLRPAPVVPAAGEADDQVRSMVSVA